MCEPARMIHQRFSAGLATGLGLGVLGGRALGGFIVEVSPADPLTLVVVTVLVLSAAATASAIPAFRAARADPLVALRNP